VIVPIILCGGQGVRFGGDVPKQFQMIEGDEPMVVETARRFDNPLVFSNPVFVTNIHQVDMLKEVLSAHGVHSSKILVEEKMLNTAPAIAMAVKYMMDHQGYGRMIIVPADHKIDKGLGVFLDMITSVDGQDHITCFGAKPTYPSSDYGYIKRGNECVDGMFSIDQFIEKPDEDKARSLIQSSDVYWNMGIFMGNVHVFKDAYKTYAPHIWSGLSAGNEGVSPISFDYAIMEHITNATMVPMDIEWREYEVA